MHSGGWGLWALRQPQLSSQCSQSSHSAEHLTRFHLHLRLPPCLLLPLTSSSPPPPLASPPTHPAGKLERKEHILDERDALFSDLRHKHFAAASIAISSLMDDFRSKNKVGKAGGRGGGVGEMELRNMSKLIQSLPQYRWAGRGCGAGWGAGWGTWLMFSSFGWSRQLAIGTAPLPAPVCLPSNACLFWHPPSHPAAAGISCPSWRRTWRLPAS